MPRLFVAIRPPASVRDALIDAMDFGVEGARWQDDDQLHLTLRFIGDVDEREVEDIVLAFSDIRAPSMPVALSGIGAFDGRGRVTTLWIGAQPRETLDALHRKIDQALIRLGQPPERRAYLPHVTLARMDRRASGCGAWVAANAGLALEPFTATAFELIESDLSSDGARYETIERFALRPSPSM